MRDERQGPAVVSPSSPICVICTADSCKLMADSYWDFPVARVLLGINTMRLMAVYLLVVVSVLGRTSLGRAEAVAQPNGTSIEKVDFERHVAPLLGKMG